MIAATNRNLKDEVAAGRFRPDLYHRLSVYPLVVPPLRERGKDVLLLAGYFLQRCERRLGLRGVRLARAAREWLCSYRWPGNVRELEHAISRAAIKALSEGQPRGRIVELNAQHLGAEPQVAPSAAPAITMGAAASTLSLQDALDRYRREIVEARLREYDGHLAATARSLGLDRGNFHRLLKRLGLR